jgi:hypothetical protein
VCGSGVGRAYLPEAALQRLMCDKMPHSLTLKLLQSSVIFPLAPAKSRAAAGYRRDGRASPLPRTKGNGDAD